MSKRTNAQNKRRQVRRALKSAPEFFGRLGTSRARNIGYGTGLSSHDIEDRSETRKHTLSRFHNIAEQKGNWDLLIDHLCGKN